MDHRLIYYSEHAQPEGSAGLDQILAASWKNNRRDGVTGLIISKGLFFIQLLEGKRSSITQTVQRIFLDKRHEKIVLVDLSQIDNRLFADWSMADFRDAEFIDQFCRDESVASGGFAPDVWQCGDFIKLLEAIHHQVLKDKLLNLTVGANPSQA